MSDHDPQAGPPNEELLDLLIKQISDHLTPAEEQSLARLRSANSVALQRGLERTAAAITLAAAGRIEPMPAHLRSRIEAQARELFPTARAGGASRVASLPVPVRKTAVSTGWWAAAACLLLAVFAWLRPLTSPPASVAALDPRAERAALLARNDSVKISFGATADPAGAAVSGDVVWDPATQRGYFRFVGLPPNDAKQMQYQIWIFDAGRDPRYPVDGGVFDVAAGRGEVIIPIHAAIPVRTAKAFAVTVEKPGGVVVSAREHVVALAQST